MSTENVSKKRSEKRQRSYRKTFRMNEEELASFLENCQAANLSDADLFRARCCDQKPSRQRRKRSLDEQALASALGQLGKIGGNLNQMAHALNVIKFRPSAEGLLSTITAIEQHLVRLETDNIETKQLIRQALLNHDPEG